MCISRRVSPQLLAVRERNRDDISRFNNKQSTNPEGYLYIVTNPSWPDMVKIGCAIDPYDRARSYQTYSPLRDYKLEAVVYSPNRRSLESNVHAELGSDRVGGEWFKLSLEDAITVMTQVAHNEVKIVE